MQRRWPTLLVKRASIDASILEDASRQCGKRVDDAPREHPRFYQIEEFTPRSFGHGVRISSEDELDADFIEWIREAYEYGEQKHLM